MARRSEILDRAAGYIGHVGFSRFSYGDLSADIGITKATIHHYFPTKEDLCIAFCRREIERMDIFEQEAEQHKLSAWVRMERYIDLYRPHIPKREMCTTNALQADYESLSPELRRWVRDMGLRELQLVVNILKKGRESGEMRVEGSLQARSYMITALLKGALHYARVYDPACFAVMVEDMLASLKPPLN